MMLILFIFSTFLLQTFSTAEDASSIVPVPPRNHTKPPRGPFASVKIIGGRPANRHEFPWQASVMSCQGNGCSICGGSLISTRYVLTAGHCATHSNYEIGIGSNELFLPAVDIHATEAIVHHLYNGGTLDHDIALIKLPRAVTLSDNVKTIKLPSSNIGSLSGSTVRVSGYGKTSDTSSVSQQLNTVDLKVISNAQCRRTYRRVENWVMCAVGLANKVQSTCSGDSGGPLVLNQNGESVQVGVVSFVSNAGCSSGHPSGYTRVSYYLPWIKEHTDI